MSCRSWSVRYLCPLRIVGRVMPSAMLAYGAMSAVVLAQEGAISAGVPAPSPDDGQWPMPAKDFANTRYSGLAEITTENVSQLKSGGLFPPASIAGSFQG